MLQRRRSWALVAGMLVAVGGMAALGQDAPTQPARGGWPMWGRRPSRNAVSEQAGIPKQWDVKSGENVRWVAPLGTQAYGGPVVAGGKVYVGTNNGGRFRPPITGDKGCLLCFDEQTGRLLWQATHDKLASGSANDWPEQGIASTPYVDGDRVYYVSNRCELVCADANGFLDDKNDGPFQNEKYTEAQDADFVWVLDMIGELGVYPHNLAACSPVGAGNLIFVCTANAVDDDHEKPPAPQAPSFIAVDKATGRVVWKRNDPGENILHGQWSSPAYATINGVPRVIFGGGDGWCYAFEPGTGEPIWKFNLNPPGTIWQIGGTGTKTSIVSTPVVCDDKVFLAVGDDPEQARGEGHLYAIDGTGRGDVTQTGRVWHVGGRDFARTISSAAIADGLVYAADFDGFLSCFDEASGRRHWRYDMEAAVWGSPLVVDGRVMLGNADGELVVLQQGATLKELARIDMRHPIYTTPVVANGVLYIATQKFLYAIGPAGPQAASRPATSAPASQPGASQPATTPTSAPAASASRSAGSDWPMFRGDPQLTGSARSALPDKLAVRWKYDAGQPVSSSAAIADGAAYVGCEDGRLLALDLASGQLRWQYQAEGRVQSSPTVAENTVYFGDETGVMHACAADSGAARWTFRTGEQIVSSVNVVDDRVIFGSYDGALYCLRAVDGRQVWRYETEDRVHATPAIAGAHALIAGCDGRLHVVNLSDGTAVRKVPLGSITGCSPAVRGPRVFLGTYGGQVLGIDWEAGRARWRFEDAEPSAGFLSSAAMQGKLVVIGGRDKRLRAFDADTGQPQWQFVTKGRIDSSPVVVGQQVFFGCDDGALYAVDLADGHEVWRFEAGGPISASPAVGEGCLVIGTEDGVIYCFGAAPSERP